LNCVRSGDKITSANVADNVKTADHVALKIAFLLCGVIADALIERSHVIRLCVLVFGMGL